MHQTPQSPRTLFFKKPFHSANGTPSHSRKGSHASLAPKPEISIPSLPQLSQYSKPENAISTEPVTATDRGLSDLELYKFSIPPDLMNVLEPSERANTVKILKTGKGLQTIIKTPLTDRRLVTGQINRNDSIETIKCILTQRMKDYERQKNGKLKGSMYVNDLWGQDYEKNIVKATHIDKELSKEQTHMRRPLNDKFHDLVTIYEKRNYNYNKKPEPVIEKITSPKTAWLEKQNARRKSTMSPLRTEPNAPHRKSPTSPIKTEPSQNTQSRPSIIQSAFAKNKLQHISRMKSIEIPAQLLSEKNLTEANIQPEIPATVATAIKKRMKSEGTIFLKDESPRRKMTTSSRIYFDMEEPKERSEVRITTLEDNDDMERSPIRGYYHPPSTTRSAMTTRSGTAGTVGTSYKSFADWKAFKGMQFNKPKGGSLASSKSPRNVSLKASSSSISFFKGTDTISRSPMSKVSVGGNDDLMGSLIYKCNTELDEKSECLGMLQEMGMLFDKKKIRARKVAAKQQREQVIEDCKYMLEKREKIFMKYPGLV